MKEATAVIILNYNNFEDTINCIDSVMLYNSALVKIIVVDNGSNRENATLKLEEYLSLKFEGNYWRVDDKLLSTTGPVCLPLCTYVESQINDGYARGNNKGLFLANLDDEITHVMILNNDTLFVEDIIPSLLEWGEKLDDSAFLSPLLLKKDNKTVDYNCARRSISYCGEIMKMLSIPLEKLCHCTKKYVCSHQILRSVDFENLKFIKVDLLSGSCLFIAKSLFCRINFFDPNTFLYFEEDILHKKIESIGLQNYLIPSLRCIHIGAQSTSSNIKNISSYSYDSEIYYLKNYCGCGGVKMLVFKCAVKWYEMWLKIYMSIWRKNVDSV